MSKRHSISKLLKATTIIGGTVFAGLLIAAKANKGNSIYDNEVASKNPFEGKKVIFIEDENEKENADGIKGHLKAVGDSKYEPTLYGKYVKRGIDIVFSFCGLVILSPVFAGIALAIKIEDPGTVLFTQKRIGRNKQYFKLHKFRSMRLDAPKDVPTHMLANPDQYITRVGKFIRAHSLDELPQIWDIFIGNMSIIGPRPGLWNQDVLIAERDKYGVNDIKPGLTGWAQINGRDELELSAKAKLDGEYVKKESLLFDIKCFVKTIGKIGYDESVVEGKKQYEESSFCNDKVSIVTPAYNAGKNIADTIESVINQSYDNWELIIIDDCSTDNTLEVANNYAKNDSRIVILKQSKNQGVAVARNRGIEYASGKYIAFLDSDDLWHKEKLKKQVQFMHDNGYVLTYTDYQKFSDNGRFGKIMKAPNQMRAKDIYSNTAIGCLTVIVDKEMAGDFQMPILKHTEDNITWQKILEKGFTAHRLGEVLAYYRDGNANSLSGSKYKSMKLQWGTYRNYYKFSIFKSGYYFTRYAANAVIRHFL